jgi:hypothetical protein
MISGAEVRRSLAGAWQLFLNRPDAMRLFDLTVEGFWRSFGAIVFIVPVFVLGTLAERERILRKTADALVISAPEYVLERLATLGVDWVALPILLFLVARPLGLDRSYPAFIIARNWTAVIASLPFGVISLLYLGGILDDQFSALLFLAALAVVLRYSFIVARTALGVGIGFATGLVAFDFLLSLLITEGLGQLLGTIAAPAG